MTDDEKRVAAIAAVLLLLEKRSLRILRSALGLTTGALLAKNAPIDLLQHGLTLAATAAIARIRIGSRQQSSRSWSSSTGLSTAESIHEGIERTRATRSAQAVTRAWREAADERAANGDPYRTAATRALDDIDGDIRRTSVTETVDAFNEETIYQGNVAYGLGYIVTDTWESILDLRTCPECAAMSGQSVTRPDMFPEPPPLHPYCRCFLSTEVRARAAA